MTIKKLALTACLALSLMSPMAVSAAESGHVPDMEWSYEGLTGTYDRASLQRGFKVYREVCSACHSLDRLFYRDLSALGYSEGQIKTIAGDVMVMDGPNEEGEMFERAGRPSDKFKSPYANTAQAQYANNGAYPPDMSLLAKARAGGASYLYGIMTGYEEPPEGTTLLQGQYWNKTMSGHIIAMAPPLTDGQIAYDDNAPQTVDQYAKDVSTFLAWAAEPHMEERKRAGIKIFLFMLALTFVMYRVKKKVWSKVH